MTDVTGLTPVMSSADSHDSTSHLLPAKVEVVVGRLIRRLGTQNKGEAGIYFVAPSYTDLPKTQE
uniref:Uncharacterized protein n=1 Tax=Oryza sativa subsp. japonica TaxID=39947 RepID=Q6K300_ORYSJ|nr:hypothetical protein [Oryza sativa Japonica Group]BAD25705.1 hypothetical protein [Oryza sativa Japonica Group]